MRLAPILYAYFVSPARRMIAEPSKQKETLQPAKIVVSPGCMTEAPGFGGGRKAQQSVIGGPRRGEDVLTGLLDIVSANPPTRAS